MDEELEPELEDGPEDEDCASWGDCSAKVLGERTEDREAS
jgi:hypothetical protein